MRVLEKESRLSESVLWELQTNAYQCFGPEAWGKRGVPFYLTSNPLIAKQFANLIKAYLKDMEADIDASEPVYILDLGAGSGRLGYLILKYLLPITEVPICYVMTDMVQSNLEFLKQHLWLEPFVESGLLEFANYKQGDQNPLVLQGSGKELKNLKNPLVLITTYFFDTIAQDLFRINAGQLEEGRVTLKVPDQDGELNPEMIMQLEASYSYVPVNTAYYKESPEMNKVLKTYTELFDDASFLFPNCAFEVIQYFKGVSNGKLLLLSGDQGVSTEAQVQNWGEPKICKHASFSMAVSYHAFKLYFEALGGKGLLTSYPKPEFVVMAAFLGGESFPRTQTTFLEQIDYFEPRDYWELTNIEPDVLKQLSLEKILLLIKLGNWDPINFHLYFSVIREKISSSTVNEKMFLIQVIDNVWDNFYPVTLQEADWVMNLGVLLFDLKLYPQALHYFNKALGISDQNPDLLRNITVCENILK